MSLSASAATVTLSFVQRMKPLEIDNFFCRVGRLESDNKVKLGLHEYKI